MYSGEWGKKGAPLATLPRDTRTKKDRHECKISRFRWAFKGQRRRGHKVRTEGHGCDGVGGCDNLEGGEGGGGGGAVGSGEVILPRPRSALTNSERRANSRKSGHSMRERRAGNVVWGFRKPLGHSPIQLHFDEYSKFAKIYTIYHTIHK